MGEILYLVILKEKNSTGKTSLHSQECDNKFCLPFSVQKQKQNKKKLCLYVAVYCIVLEGGNRRFY